MALASSLARHQAIVQMVDCVQRADKDFGQDLWLIAERIALQRITKSYDSRLEIQSISDAIGHILSESKSSSDHSDSNGHNLDSSGSFYETSNLSRGFSFVVDLIERLDSSNLYKLIAWLRNERTSNRQD